MSNAQSINQKAMVLKVSGNQKVAREFEQQIFISNTLQAWYNFKWNSKQKKQSWGEKERRIMSRCRKHT
jgi:hypothetical protein